MLYPSVDSLSDIVEGKFALVAIVSKRARQLQAGKTRNSIPVRIKSVTVALNELKDKKITFSLAQDTKQKK